MHDDADCTPASPPPAEVAAPRPFAAAWDNYAAHATPPPGGWPGDEWGDEALWSAWFRRLFEPYGVATWRRAIEVGQGAGKYTARVLAAGPAQVLALDVSSRFLELCRQRFAPEIAAGRLDLAQIDERDARSLALAAARRGWSGSADAVYSIDTLVHLTAHQIAALLLSATEALAPGGVFIGTFANATSESGMRKLLADVPRVLAAGGDAASGCFHWSCPELISALARACGYDVLLCDLDPAHRRDGHFVLRHRR